MPKIRCEGMLSCSRMPCYVRRNHWTKAKLSRQWEQKGGSRTGLFSKYHSTKYSEPRDQDSIHKSSNLPIRTRRTYPFGGLTSEPGRNKATKVYAIVLTIVQHLQTVCPYGLKNYENLGYRLTGSLTGLRKSTIGRARVSYLVQEHWQHSCPVKLAARSPNISKFGFSIKIELSKQKA